jgi:2-succinyl-6-hydroxy-2,4-cyclohexadiene-1-carboxylate synthase
MFVQVSGTGPPVTLLHGFMQDGSSWAELLRLMPAQWRWLRPDLPGHGQSPAGAAPSVSDAAAELIAEWDRLGVERSHLAGYSLGGRLALYLAVEHPDRLLSLATIGAHAGLEPGARAARAAADAALADRIEAEGMDWFAGHWAAQPMFAALADRADLDAMRRAQDPAGIAAALRGLGPAAVEPFWDRLGGVTVPGLFIAGAEDGRYPDLARRLAAAVPRGRAAVVRGAGHAVHLEQPEAVAGLLAAHLSSR